MTQLSYRKNIPFIVLCRTIYIYAVKIGIPSCANMKFGRRLRVLTTSWWPEPRGGKKSMGDAESIRNLFEQVGQRGRGDKWSNYFFLPVPLTQIVSYAFCISNTFLSSPILKSNEMQMIKCLQNLGPCKLSPLLILNDLWLQCFPPE